MKNRMGFGLMAGLMVVATVFVVLSGSGCSTDRAKNQAKEAAAKYWQDKAYPGKSFEVQVVEAEKAEGGMWRVKGIVDGETRVGMFSPETETFSEGYYSLAHERNKRVAELEQEVKYWKEKAENLEKDNYKMKVRMSMGKKGKGARDSDAEDDESAVPTPEKKKE